MADDLVERLTEPPSHVHRMVSDTEMMHRAANVIERQAAELTTLRDEVGHLTDQLTEAQNAPWPKWAEVILAKMREYDADGVDDGDIDLCDIFEEWVDGFVDACERDVTTLRSKLKAAEEAADFLREGIKEIATRPEPYGARRLARDLLAALPTLTEGRESNAARE